ncbi:MAG TPA: ATP-binding protein [Planctomycetaceae bacterium]|jgi:two-component system OmpR family sensor kinase|nr:ATP-binding protein [Planctomycetaceae bacterium]
MFRSIRWTLQMWHAAILATVLIVFGWVVFYLVRVTTYQHIDDGLHRMADLVAAGLRPVFARGPNDRGPGGRPGGGRAASDRTPAVVDASKKVDPERTAEARPDTADSKSRPQAAQTDPVFPPGFGGRRGPRVEPRWELNEEFPRFFEEELGSTAYFVVWRGDGHVRLSSQSATDVPLPELHPEPHSPAVRLVRQRGAFREVVHQIHQGRRDSSILYILVGRSIESDVASLHKEGWMLGGVGLGVLAAGLIGGFWFSRRAIKPIEAISAAAAEISLSNLSRRIDVSGTETELTGLARTLNQMIDRLESAFSQQVRFTADASHELRTPLAVILSHAELALDKARPANELRETIETCRRSALRMKSVVESLLTLARFDSGELQLECRPVDLARIVGDCVALVRSLAEKRRIVIELDLESAGLIADSDRVSQVVMNLLTNAIRYNHDDGRVMVTTRSSKSEVILSISDTGIGIELEHLPHIFERFYRVDKARSRRDGGIGLGLAICKSIVEAHGGQIMVTSNAEGGSRFEVRLPKRGARLLEDTRDSEASRMEIVAASAKGLLEVQHGVSH